MVGILEKIGQRIREIRLHRELTQEKLGELTGVSYSYIGRIERGQKNISLLTLEKIATALEISEMDLFTYTKKSDLLTQMDMEIKDITEVLLKEETQTVIKAKNILYETLKQLKSK